MIGKSIVSGFVVVILVSAPAAGVAQSEVEKREAAANAYDRGTAAFMQEDYTKAAQWFETAYRLAPAYQALLQAVRPYVKAGNEPRAGTLAVEITLQYPAETQAVQYATEILAGIEPSYYRVEVSCDGCTLEVNGTLQQYTTFFLEPDTPHTVIASFDTGDVLEEVEGGAGDSHTVLLERPQPTGTTVDTGRDDYEEVIRGRDDYEEVTTGRDDDEGVDEPDSEHTDDRKPLPPIVTFIASGATLALGVTAAVVGIDALSGVEQYKDAAAEATEACESDNADCYKLDRKARELLSEGQSKENLFNILIVVTAGAAVATGVIAVFFTEWSDVQESEPKVRVGMTPITGGGMATIRASF